ncbi:TM223 protein, partial [Scopus umbretta]|nr:TM223 protein [Scopus umbretta]
QGVFWAYLAHFAFTALRPAPGIGPDDPLRPRDHKWRSGRPRSRIDPRPFPPTGSLIVAAGCLFPLRAVRRVTLLRGGSEVTISTHGPLGLGRGPTFTVPLRHISCRAHRSEVPVTIPLKVKGRPFFFLLDKQGQLCHPRLFDITVGAYRKL